MTNNNSNSGNDTTFAFLVQTEGEEVVTAVMCNNAFRYPSLDEIFDPPAWGRDAAGNVLPGFGCDGLGDLDSGKLELPVLHDPLSH